MTLRVTITRERTDDLGTYGRMRIEGKDFTCLTGELPWRGNKPGLSCTKAGVYATKLQNSQHFKVPLYHLEDRDGRVAEEIHPGNWCGDVTKGFKSDVRGCILLGNTIGDILRPDKTFQKGVGQSHDALERFMKITAGEDLELTIIWKGIDPEKDGNHGNAAESGVSGGSPDGHGTTRPTLGG